MPPKISICIPAYQQADKLQILFQSIEIQDFRDFEVIVTDDSPDDAVEKLCLQPLSFKVIYHRNPQALGSPENWNSAIAMATGEWIKLIHHDDFFSRPDALTLFVAASIAEPEIDYFFCTTNIYDSNTGENYVYEVNKSHLDNIAKHNAFLFHKNLIGAPSTGFFKRDIAISYDKKLIWLVDIDYYIRVLSIARIRCLYQPLVTTVISEQQLTTQLKNNRNVEIREFVYCYHKLIGQMDRLNRKIMRHRMLDLFQTFEISSHADLKSTGLLTGIPTFAYVFLYAARLNRKLAFRVFYKLNQFSIS